MTDDYTVIAGCRSCGAPDLEPVLDLGLMPLSDGLVPPGADRRLEPRYPLRLVRCVVCSLLQILETVDPKVLFGASYPYYSSFSERLVAHARSNVSNILSRKHLDGDSLVVELASNDGYLLQWFQEAAIPVLGIDPAPGPAAAAIERGVPTLCDFFDPELARRLSDEGVVADVIVGNNVLAHVPDQNALIEAMSTLLAPSGAIVMEFPYAVDMIDRCEFDTIYHEHHCYFTAQSVMPLFQRHGFGMAAVERLDIHGGSLRVWMERDAVGDRSVEALLSEEVLRGVTDAAYYSDFATRVERLRNGLVETLGELRDSGARVAGYGAAAKAAILLNHCGIGPDLLPYVVDLNTHKHGMEMPGVPIPIHGVDQLMAAPPDYLLLLAWNHAEEIMRQQGWFAEQGGRFIVPIPEVTVVAR
ncbi:MAG: class I SAM-dependent methyltransferase [Actinobacteria bacterium]|nr:class I SAM-dependent methyltransferase [Actinomycetota bacterium]MCI0677525.1 class I SAM-dependent methyltransferase [Actinomycetota bacterium]